MKLYHLKTMLLALIASALFITGCVPAPRSSEELEDPVPVIQEPDKVRFIAAGDNLIHGVIYMQAARRAGYNGYDFDYPYENTESYFDDFDVKFINQETLVNGAFEPSTYPQFSSPTALGDKVISMGFNVIGTSNNHSYDRYAKGVNASLEYWNSKDVVNVGFYTGDDDVDIKYLTVNNIKMAFLAYTYGTNGLSIDEANNPHIIHCDDFDIIERQVAKAKENSDILIVSCHWGYEDTNETNDYQKKVADKLCELGVDVIIGTHPHVIQTVEWHTNEVNDNRTLICYSLGNFISAQSRANNMLAGLFQFDINKIYDEEGNYEITITDPYFVPTVTHYDYEWSNVRNYLLKDYSADMASKHGVRAYDGKFSMSYMENLVRKYIPEEFLLYEFKELQ